MENLVVMLVSAANYTVKTTDAYDTLRSKTLVS